MFLIRFCFFYCHSPSTSLDQEKPPLKENNKLANPSNPSSSLISACHIIFLQNQVEISTWIFPNNLFLFQSLVSSIHFVTMLTQIKMILLSFIGLFRRAMCCFSRRRKPSMSESESLQCVNVVVDNNYHLKKSNQGQDRDWNSWDDAPRTVEEHIEQYRQKIAKPPTPKDEEPEPDFFSEMTPKIKPQLKVYLGQDKEQDKRDFSRLEAKSDVPIAVNADLEDWMEEDPGGWEELDTETTKQLIREKRKELRHQKNAHQKSKNNNGIVNDNSPRHENFALRIGSKNT